MVNLNSDESLKVPINDIKKRQVMEKRESVNQAITRFYYNGEHEAEEVNIVRASVISLFLELGEHINRFYGENTYTEIRTLVYSKGLLDKLEEAYSRLDKIISEVIDVNREQIL